MDKYHEIIKQKSSVYAFRPNCHSALFSLNISTFHFIRVKSCWAAGIWCFEKQSFILRGPRPQRWWICCGCWARWPVYLDFQSACLRLLDRSVNMLYIETAVMGFYSQNKQKQLPNSPALGEACIFTAHSSSN